MNNNSIDISPSATKRIIELKSKIGNEDKHLRITVFGGGCNGLRYEFALDNKINSDDFEVNNKNKIILTIDKTSLNFISGGTIDYICDLGSSYFKINNPNAKSSCGCGDSFSI